jgi:hypothetical protein
MVTTPNIHMEFGLCGTCGHDHFTITDDLGVWIPSGMDVGLRHGSGVKKRMVISVWRIGEPYGLS